MHSRPVWPTYWVLVQPGTFHLSWTINPGYMNIDSCVCSQLLKLAGVALLCQALCLPWALCSSSFFHCVVSDPLILSYPGWWFPHVTITDMFISSIQLIPPTFRYKPTPVTFFYVVCVCVVCARISPRQMAGIILHYLSTLSRVSQEKKIQSLLVWLWGSHVSAFWGLPHTSYLYVGFWGCLPSKHQNPWAISPALH